MSGLGDLYQEILLEHNSKPRNFRKPDQVNQSAEGYNPLCGDEVTVYLNVADGTIADVGFQGTGCAISRASASMMTQSVKGQTLDQAAEIFDAFHQMMTEPGAEPDYDTLGDLEFSGRRYRVSDPHQVRHPALAHPQGGHRRPGYNRHHRMNLPDWWTLP